MAATQPEPGSPRLAVSVAGPAERDPGQRLPGGMASVCRPLSGGERLGQASENRIKGLTAGQEDRRHRDQGLALFEEPESC